MNSALRKAKHWLQKLYAHHPGFADLQRGVDEAKVLAAQHLVNDIRNRGIVDDLSVTEFRVFSQFGEDGILQYLIQHVPIPHTRFVEFGVGKYTEANTRFLLLNDNWSGLVMDGDPYYVDYIRKDRFYWRNDLNAVCAFVDRDNINTLLEKNGFADDIGVLSIDIDGNDYWIWESVSVIKPAIVVVEYNSVFGSRRAVTIPYDRSFERFKAHFSGLYWGASLKAFCNLAAAKNYSLIGSNSAGHNAFFVRNDLVGDLKTRTCEMAYVESRFRDSRDAQGRFTYLTGDARRQMIENLPVWDLEANRMVLISELSQTVTYA